MPLLQELANGSRTRVRDRQWTAKMRDSRPRFSGVGCVVLSLVPACHAGGREFESRRPRQYPQTREPRPDERDQADATFQRVEEILQVVFIARALGDGFGVAGVGHGLLGLTRGQPSWGVAIVHAYSNLLPACGVYIPWYIPRGSYR